MKSLGEMQSPASSGSPCGRRLSAWSFFAVVLLGAALNGCSSKYDALVRDVQGLKTELSRIRGNNMMLQDRIDAIEDSGPGIGTAVATGSGGQPSDRPVLEVVTLTPQDALGEEEPLSSQFETIPEGERPTIVGDSEGVERLAEGQKRAEKKDAKKAKLAGHGRRSARGVR